VVMAVPEAGPNVLGIDVVWSKDSCREFTERLEYSAKSGQLRWRVGVIPGPDIAKIAVMEVVGESGRDVGRQSGHEIPRILWTISQRCGNSDLPTYHSSDIYLIVRRLG